MDPKLLELKQSFPGRDKQINQLYNFFAHEDEPFVPSVYVYGGPSTGKTAVVTSFLRAFNSRHAIVNMVECYTPKLLFDSVLNQLSGQHKIDRKCENLMNFVWHLGKASETLDLNGSVIVLDNAEMLRELDHNLLAAFLRIRELSGLAVTVVLMSEIVLEKYYYLLNIVEPIKIHFTQYSKDELLEILSLDFNQIQLLMAENFDFDLDFYRNYLNVLLSVFYRVCRDVSELRHMSKINFVKYCEPILKKECDVDNLMALWRHISPILKSSLEVLYLRISSDDSQKDITGLVRTIELPFYAKYLLIAAYLASYNSTKDDKRLFMKGHTKQRKTRKDILAKSKVSERLSTQMGPKPFTLDRLLAIFYSILNDKIGFNNHILVQVSSLVELQLLTLISDHSTLDGRKYKCNVNFECIQSISKMVGLNIRKYLSDFSHM